VWERILIANRGGMTTEGRIRHRHQHRHLGEELTAIAFDPSVCQAAPVQLPRLFHASTDTAPVAAETPTTTIPSE
jgi:hypothetical protein